jgi:transcriptional regulator with XRE-family HTH domain
MAQRFNSKADALEFGRRLRKARKKAGLSMEKLQNELGVDHSQISRIERGCAATMSANVQKLSARLRIDLPVKGGAQSGGDLAKRVRALARSTPAAAEALAAVVSALESMTIVRR